MNRLSGSTSPYLLQHANNPVDWHPWGVEALSKAKQEDKPIFLSIGYAACHWCHVMAHESFEDPETAFLMNKNFINIKVDREERPDIDSIYMQAVVAMTGSGGWPMSVFLDPDLKPFYAGTYFPPTPRYNMPAFRDVLTGLNNAWINERAEIDRVGRQIEHYLHDQSKKAGFNKLSLEHLDAISRAIQAAYDWGYGGWGDAPKFPQPMVLEFLMQHSIRNGDEGTNKLVKHCLEIMARGGMYDIVGGGFSRYSTDQFWRVPHFEKMLYDNALLVPAYLHAWQITGEPAFKRTVKEILDFVSRELTHPGGGFFSSLDADSEGVEGKYYIWSQDEIRSVLKEDSEFFEAAYGINAKGNWEGSTILQRVLDNPSLAVRFKLGPEEVPEKLSSLHARLLSVRESRTRPGTDDKVLTSWNGLMMAAFAEVGRVLKNSSYVNVATRNAEFLLASLRTDGQLRRAWRHQATTQEVFLEDYAALILGFLELYQTDFNNKWFLAACTLADEMIEKFMDPRGGFFDTPDNAKQLLIRPRDIQDNAIPCGNSMACEVLLKLAAFTGRGDYRELAEKSLSLIGDMVLKYPLGFARWLSACELAYGGIRQVAVIGETGSEAFDQMIQATRNEYLPGWVIAASSTPSEENIPALLRDRDMIGGKPTAYICRNFICNLPTNDLAAFKERIKSKEA